MDDLHSGKEGKRAGIFRIGFPIARRHLMKEGEEGATLVTKPEGGGGRRKKTEEERVFSVLHKMKKVWKDAFRPKVRKGRSIYRPHFQERKTGVSPLVFWTIFPAKMC